MIKKNGWDKMTDKILDIVLDKENETLELYNKLAAGPFHGSLKDILILHSELKEQHVRKLKILKRTRADYLRFSSGETNRMKNIIEDFNFFSCSNFKEALFETYSRTRLFYRLYSLLINNTCEFGLKVFFNSLAWEEKKQGDRLAIACNMINGKPRNLEKLTFEIPSSIRLSVNYHEEF
jgi:hypothetical protein